MLAWCDPDYVNELADKGAAIVPRRKAHTACVPGYTALLAHLVSKIDPAVGMVDCGL